VSQITGLPQVLQEPEHLPLASDLTNSNQYALSVLQHD